MSNRLELRFTEFVSPEAVVDFIKLKFNYIPKIDELDDIEIAGDILLPELERKIFYCKTENEDETLNILKSVKSLFLTMGNDETAEDIFKALAYKFGAVIYNEELDRIFIIEKTRLCHYCYSPMEQTENNGTASYYVCLNDECNAELELNEKNDFEIWEKDGKIENIY